MSAAGQSATVSPFVSYVPSAATNPLAGFALSFGGTTGMALRSSAEMSLSTPAPRVDSVGAATAAYRPWGADVDAMLFLGGLGNSAMRSRGLTPYVFAGLGLTGRDSAGRNVVDHGWSYGAGANLPLGPYADIFGEMRWRMSQYVLPTSNGAPDSKSAMRFGLSFHVGGGGGGMSPGYPRRGGRHRAQDDVEYVTAAPAEPQVVVVQPAEPQVVVVEQEPAAPQQVVIVEPEPVYEPAPTRTTVTTTTSQSTRPASSRVLGGRARTSTTQQTTVTTAPTRSRGSSRVVVGGSNARTRVTTQPSRTQGSAASTVRRPTSRATTTTRATTSTTRRVQTSKPGQSTAPARARSSTTKASSKSTTTRRTRQSAEPQRDQRQD